MRVSLAWRQSETSPVIAALAAVAAWRKPPKVGDPRRRIPTAIFNRLDV